MAPSPTDNLHFCEISRCCISAVLSSSCFASSIARICMASSGYPSRPVKSRNLSISSFFNGSVFNFFRKLSSAISKKPLPSDVMYSSYTSLQIRPRRSSLQFPIRRQHSGSVDLLYLTSLLHCSRIAMSSLIRCSRPRNCCRYQMPRPRHPQTIIIPPSTCIPSVPFLSESQFFQTFLLNSSLPVSWLHPLRPLHVR